MNSSREFDTIEQFLEDMNRDTSLEVLSLLKKNPARQVRWNNLLVAPLVSFVQSYFGNQNNRKGTDRFVCAVLDGIAVLSLLAKLWEYRMREREGKNNLPPLTNADLKHLNRL